MIILFNSTFRWKEKLPNDYECLINSYYLLPSSNIFFNNLTAFISSLLNIYPKLFQSIYPHFGNYSNFCYIISFYLFLILYPLVTLLIHLTFSYLLYVLFVLYSYLLFSILFHTSLHVLPLFCNGILWLGLLNVKQN